MYLPILLGKQRCVSKRIAHCRDVALTVTAKEIVDKSNMHIDSKTAMTNPAKIVIQRSEMTINVDIEYKREMCKCEEMA